MKKKINDTIYEVVEGIRVNEDGRAYRILQGMYDNSICYNNIKAVDPDEPVVPPVEPDIPEGTTHIVECGTLDAENMSKSGVVRDHSQHWEHGDVKGDWEENHYYTYHTRNGWYTAWGSTKYVPLNTLSYIEFGINSDIINSIPDDAVIKSITMSFGTGAVYINAIGRKWENTHVETSRGYFTYNGKIVELWNGPTDSWPGTEYAGYVLTASDLSKACLESARFRFEYPYDKRHGDHIEIERMLFKIEYVTYE